MAAAASAAPAAGVATAEAAVLAGVGALCVLFPPVGVAVAAATKAGAVALAGKGIAGGN